jgi:glycosyltransferase involved in cell wall biosynthesis
MKHRSVTSKVTVFIPTYNRAELLAGAIESVLAQTYADFRLAVFDNASTDATPDVVARYRDPRIEYVRHDENTGVLGNQQRCLASLESEYALILADDDLIYPKLLEATVRVLEANSCAGVVHTGFDMIGAAGELLLADCNWTYGLANDTLEDPGTFVERSMVSSCRVCSSTALIRGAAIPAGGMVEEDFPAIDFGLWLRIAGDGWRIAFVADTLGAYRVHGASHTAAYGQVLGPGYVNTDQLIMTNYEVKRRFIAEYVDDPARARRLRVLARRGHRIALISRARALTLPTRRRGPTIRALADAVRLAPDVLVDPGSWRLAVVSVLGPNIVNRLRPMPAAAGRDFDPPR